MNLTWSEEAREWLLFLQKQKKKRKRASHTHSCPHIFLSPTSRATRLHCQRFLWESCVKNTCRHTNSVCKSLKECFALAFQHTCCSVQNDTNRPLPNKTVTLIFVRLKTYVAEDMLIWATQSAHLRFSHEIRLSKSERRIVGTDNWATETLCEQSVLKQKARWWVSGVAEQP